MEGMAAGKFGLAGLTRRLVWLCCGMAALGLGNAEAGSKRLPRVTVAADAVRGRLVRKVVWDGGQKGKTSEELRETFRLDSLIQEAAEKEGLDPLLIHAVISVESGYNPFAISGDGAQGLMQLLPRTARRFGVRNTFDPRENLRAGVRYLRQLLEKFGDLKLALAAYNAGEGAVARHGRVPPFAETQDYVERIVRRYRELQQGGSDHQATEQPTGTEEAMGRPVEVFIDEEGRLCLRTR